MSEPLNNAQVDTKKSTSAIIKKEKHFIKYVFAGLFVLILIISVVAIVKIRRLQEENVKQKLTYENKIDSIHYADMSSMTKTFSWAVRGDLLRNNIDQAQLHIDNLLKEPHVKKAYFIDAQTNKVLLSSEKNQIGSPCADFTILNANETQLIKGSNNIVRIVSPVMNLNKKLGISVVEIEKER